MNQNLDFIIFVCFFLGILFGLIPSALVYRRKYIQLRAFYTEDLNHEYRVGYHHGMDYMSQELAKESKLQKAPKSLQFPIDLE